MDVIETFTNTFTGIAVSFLVNLYVLPMVGVETTFTTAWGITAIFFVVSTARTYILRRLFRWLGDVKSRLAVPS